ncbi:hypothetical protein HGO37_05995 [Rhizobium sp. CG4]|uniref:hypothetical protein n=1 Tax=Rhizobium sp. CG4 TaxID=2726075 RepID=UPI0020349DE0|nr:hypothetical protein [Rhizobium sp. CG4]MCM2454936.1 hypothetical protein [Rhizobium sp. CG4]
MLSVLQNIATLAATAVGVYVAVGGLHAWRRETMGRRDIELCQTVIEKFYEAEHKISRLRSPMSYFEEGSSRKPEIDETEEETNRRNLNFVPIARFNAQYDFWAEFLGYRFRMRALFGDRAVAPFTSVDAALRSFRAAAVTRSQALYKNPNGLNLETLRSFEEVIWEHSSDDAISKQIKQAIVDMEAVCIPIVRANSRSWLTHVWYNGLGGI